MEDDDEEGFGIASKMEFGFMVVVVDIRDHGHACGSRRSELTNYLGENPGGILGTAQANPCCWLTPIGP